MGASHWIDPERIFDRVVALGDDVVYTGNPSSAKATEMKQALEAGEPPALVLKDGVTAIPFGTILMVSWNRHADDINIAHKGGKEKESENLAFSSREERDDFAAQLAERLPGYQDKVVEYGPLRAALSPVAFGGLTVFFTWLLHMAAIEIASGREAEFAGRNAGIKRLVYWALDVVGPVGVLVAGGLVLALTGWRLVSRLKTPPIMHSLKRPKS